MQMPTKQCSKCWLWLPYDQFYSNPTSRDKLAYCCKTCYLAHKKATYDPDQGRVFRLLREFNMTLSQYNQMLVEQDGVCKSCKKPETALDGRTKKIRPLAIDHDHKTGDVRALLCHTCNITLGLLHEDPERIKALLAYAEWCQTREPDRKIIQLPIEMET